MNGGTIQTDGAGDVILRGRGGNIGSNNCGVFLDDESVVQSTGMGPMAGSVTLNGTGGAGLRGNYGVGVWDGSKVTSVDGDIVVTGVAGTGDLGDHYGVTLYNSNTGDTGGEISTTGLASIRIDGTGGTGGNANVGVGIEQSDSRVTSVNGSIEITGAVTDGASTAVSIGAEEGTASVATTAGSVTLTTDILFLDFGASVDTGANPLTVQPRTAGTAIVINGADGSSTLGLSPGELFRISAGTLIIGNSLTAGSITIPSPLNFAQTTQLFLRTAEMVLFNENVDLSGGNLTVEAGEIRVKRGTTLKTEAGQVLFTGPGGQESPEQVVLQAVDNGAGVLIVDGNLVLPDNLVHKVELIDDSPATGHDVLFVTGGVTLNNPILNLDVGFSPAEGATFKVLDNEGNAPISGTYAGLPEGKVFTAGGLVFRITYRGGTGNDVVLRRVAAPPANLVVDNAGDDDDGDFSAGQLTLREAINLANVAAVPNAVSFAAALNGQTITLGGTQLPELDGQLTIAGPGADLLAIDAAGLSRVFSLAAMTEVAISGLTIRGGNSTGNGGAIHNASVLTLTACTLADSTGDSGGALFNLGALTLIDCTVSGNTGRFGAGVYNSGTATIINSTVSGNSSIFSGGGGIYNDGTVQMTNCTVVLNQVPAEDSGGGLINYGTFTLNNTIVAGNTQDGRANDLAGPFTGRHNLIGNGSFAGNLSTADGNILGDGVGGTLPLTSIVDPTLRDNGGPTPTHALAEGSPAQNAGDDAQALDALGAPLTADQRGAGFPRFVGTVDVGAFEAAAVASAGLMPDPLNPGQMSLMVQGDAAPNDIRVQAKGGRVEVFIDGESMGTFRPTGRVVVEGGGGDDAVLIKGSKLPAWVFGGPGNDTLTTGGGKDVVVGGEGDDTLKGGKGRDVLIGGAGRDTLKGQEGQDILVAGFTDYDGADMVSQQALAAIAAAWTAGGSGGFQERVEQLRDTGVGGGNSVKLNAATVHDDGEGDELRGRTSDPLDVLDWFLANQDSAGMDTLLGRRTNDVVTDIDVLEM